MFEELLVPKEHISFQKQSQGISWRSKKGYFFFEKNPGNNKWIVYINKNFWTKNYIRQITLASEEEIEIAKQKFDILYTKSFSTLKQAYQESLNIFENLLSKQEYQKMDKEIKKDITHYFDILVKNTNFQKESDLYLQGKNGEWKMYFDADKPSYQNNHFFQNIFSKSYTTRPAAINILYDNIAQRLDELYFSTKNYSKQKQLIEEEHHLWMANDGWWMLFVDPKTDLIKVFS